MNNEELKKKLLKLWKEIFNNSDDYLSLVFNRNFYPEYLEYEEVNGDIVAAVMGVPYEFGNADNRIKALYISGMLTRPQYRSRGIMTRLLTRINDKAREQGFVFSFLLPHNDGLRQYFHDREYVNGFYRVVDNYTNLHDFDKEYESVLTEQKEKVADLKRKLYSSLKGNVYDVADADAQQVKEGIHSLIRELEDVQQDLQIIHSDHDIDLIMEQNMLEGAQIYYVKNNSGKITAVAFCSIADNAVDIHKLYSADLGSKFKVLSLVKTSNPSRSMRHYIPSIEMDRAALWMRTYGSFLKEAPQAGAISITERVYSLAAHAKVYGMARILDFPEILKFQANCRRDLKYSILVKGEDGCSLEQINVRDGKLAIKRLPIDEKNEARHTHVMTKRDIGEILFRRRDTDNLITEAFGIPSINGAISLLLD